MKTLLSLVSFAALTLAASATTPNPNPTQTSNSVGTLPEFTVTASRTSADSEDGKVGQMAEFIVIERAAPAKKSPASAVKGEPTAPSTQTPGRVAAHQPTTVAAAGI